ncbi:MAG: glutathione-dependent formaldehyde dehydrogenase [Armatimonadetes bacterium]|nr:glutathione-dependent formaldehyde dehydrogenase [Armatimonadota bacterium]
MKALAWHGKNDVRIDNVPDPKIINDRDAIIKITSTAICGSDLHLYNGFTPGMMAGDILGHEFMGEVVETGKGVSGEKLKKGDRVVVPFNIACGNCFFCKRDLYSSCDNTNPNAGLVEKQYGYAGSALFGYSHTLGGYAGGQAEYVRVPFADVGPYKVPEGLTDEQVLFLTDIFPTGYMAAENCNIQPGDTVAVWGAGPVGLFAIKSAFLLGAERVLAIDRFPERLALAQEAGAIPINYEQTPVQDEIRAQTHGMGADSCIDAVGLEAHGISPDAIYDKVMQVARLGTDRIHVLREAIMACRKSGTVSLPGVYVGIVDKMPMGAAFGKGLTLKMGQTHVQKYLPKLMGHIQNGDLDPTFLITHTLPLEQAPEAYKIFKEKKDGCVKVVLKPHTA